MNVSPVWSWSGLRLQGEKTFSWVLTMTESQISEQYLKEQQRNRLMYVTWSLTEPGPAWYALALHHIWIRFDFSSIVFPQSLGYTYRGCGEPLHLCVSNGPEAFWNLHFLRLCFQGQTLNLAQIVLSKPHCKLKVLQEVRVELSVRAKCYGLGACGASSALKHNWGRNMSILFHSTTANRNTDDVYIFTLILNRGLLFPVGVSADTYRLISWVKEPPGSGEGLRKDRKQQKGALLTPVSRRLSHYCTTLHHAIYMCALPSTNTHSLSSSFTQSRPEEGKGGMYYSLLWHHYNSIRRHWRHICIWVLDSHTVSAVAEFHEHSEIPEFELLWQSHWYWYSRKVGEVETGRVGQLSFHCTTVWTHFTCGLSWQMSDSELHSTILPSTVIVCFVWIIVWLH